MDITLAWNTADVFMALMAVTNIVAIIGLSKIVFKVSKDYSDQLKAGRQPVFYIDNVDIDKHGIGEWDRGRYDKTKDK